MTSLRPPSRTRSRSAAADTSCASIPSSPLASGSSEHDHTHTQCTPSALSEIFAELTTEEQDPLQFSTPKIPSPPVSTVLLVPNQISPPPALGNILISPPEPLPSRSTPFLEPAYKRHSVLPLSSNTPSGSRTSFSSTAAASLSFHDSSLNNACDTAPSSPFSVSPLASTPTLPSPTITTPFYKPQEVVDVSRSPLFTPPSKAAASRRTKSNNSTNNVKSYAASSIAAPKAVAETPKASIAKLDEKLHAISNVSPTLISPDLPSPPVSTPFLQSAEKASVTSAGNGGGDSADRIASSSAVAATPSVSAPPTSVLTSSTTKNSTFAHHPHLPPPLELPSVVVPTDTVPCTPLPQIVHTPQEPPCAPSPAHSAAIVISAPQQSQQNIPLYEIHAASRNPVSPSMAKTGASIYSAFFASDSESESEQKENINQNTLSVSTSASTSTKLCNRNNAPTTTTMTTTTTATSGLAPASFEVVIHKLT